MDLIRECETLCVAGCCGTDAFARDADMMPWLRLHQDQFLLVMDQLVDSLIMVRDHKGPVRSEQSEFNAVWTNAGAVQYLREWRQTIVESAAKVYGSWMEVAPAWRTADVLALARGIASDRAFDRLPILADALQDAGCTSDDILTHCRSDGPHARGCWVVDLVLGKA